MSTSADLRTDTAVTSTAAQWWRRWRTAFAVGALVIVAGILLAIIRGLGPGGDLDPNAATHNGSRALAELLRNQGIDVKRTVGVAPTAQAAGPGSTILIIDPDSLTTEQAQELRLLGADLVVVGVDLEELVDVFIPGLQLDDPADVRALDPSCSLHAAQLAGAVTLGGVRYSASPDSTDTMCYLDSLDNATLVQRVEDGGQTITLLGAGNLLRNDHLTKQGNASLAMNLLGKNPTLVWEMPSLADAADAPRKSLNDQLPPWVDAMVFQLAIAVILFALWRARRLGPVVEEPLPVVVRSAEVSEGRARMYRRSHARDRAATELRRAVIARLVPLLGLPGGTRTADASAVTSTIAQRTGRPTDEVTALLYGGIPLDDGALVVLADELDRLDREVRRS